MNFLCENCKQKYHVADEKIRGREVTKFKCKKCEHIIEVRGDAVSAGDDTEVGSASMLSLPPQAAAAPVAPKPASTSGLGAASAPRPASSGLPTSAASKPAGTGFPAAGANKPLGGGLPTSAASKPSTSALPTSAASKPAGTGLPTAGAAPRPAATAAPRPAGAGLGTATSSPKPTTTNTAPTSGATALKPAPAAKPAQPSALRSSITQSSGTSSSSLAAQNEKEKEGTGPRRTSSSASTSALLNPSETGWYAGIREVPVGPLTRAELATKIDSGDITTDTLVWREGLDDWRPLSAVNELSDLLREASKRVSDTMLGAPKKGPSNVVPISRANTQRDAEESEESTRLTSLSDLIATAEGSSAAKKPVTKSEPALAKTEPRTEPKSEPKSEPAAAKAPAHEIKSEPVVEAKAPAHEIKSEPKSEPSDLDDAFFMGPSKKDKPVAAAIAASAPAVAAAAAAPTPAPTAKVEPNPYGLPLNPPAPSATVASVAPPKEEKKGGVPMGMIVMFGGALVLVGGGGLYAGTRINNQAPTQPAQTQPAPQPAQQPQPRIDPSVGAHVDLNQEPAQQPQQPAAQPTPPTPATQPAVAANTGAHAPSGSTGSHAPRAGGSSATSTGTSTTLTAAQLAAMNAQMQAMGGGISTTNAGGPSGASRNVPTSSAPEPTSGPTGGARAQQVLQTFSRTNVVGSCWQQQITRNPAHPPERLVVTLTVGTTGRATAVNVGGANDAALASCIQNRARSQNFGPGGAIDAQASFNLAIGN